MNAKQFISIISDLPFDLQAEIVDQIMHTFHQSSSDVEQAWMNEVERRNRKIDSGEVKMIPGDQAMQRLRAITRK